MKKIAAMTITISCLASSCAIPGDSVNKTPLESVSHNYITLISGIPGVLALYASAVVVRPGIAVTNAHVVAATDRLAGWVDGRGLVPVTVLAVSDRMDLALLQVPTDLGGPLRVASPAAQGAIWAMGTTANFWQSPVTSGQIVNARAWACADFRATDPHTCRHIDGLMLAGDIQFGYSGGPVVDPSGAVVGLTQGIYTEVENRPQEGQLAFALPMDAVLREVDRLSAALPQ